MRRGRRELDFFATPEEGLAKNGPPFAVHGTRGVPTTMQPANNFPETPVIAFFGKIVSRIGNTVIGATPDSLGGCDLHLGAKRRE
jgi:hypothetical protein